MTENEVREYLQQEAQKHGSARRACAVWGISQQYFSDVINGRKSPGESILIPLGLERVVTYRKKEKSNGKAKVKG